MVTSKDTILGKILSRLENVTPSGDGHTARCPAHDDKQNSLSISEGDGGWVLIKCHAGCSFDAIVRVMALKPTDFRGKRSGTQTRRVRDTPPNNTSTRQQSTDAQDATQTEPPHDAPGDTTSTGQPLDDGLTLAQYAGAKKLPVEFLAQLGVKEQRSKNLTGGWTSYLRIPYLLADGTEGPVRYRSALTGDKFTWAKGAKPCLYGLNRAGQWRDTFGYAVLVEGESDFQTLIYHNIPVFGLPGAANYKDERDAEHFEGIETVYVVIEPDKGGEAVKKWLATASIRDRVRLVSLEEHKDPSALHIADPDAFKARFKAALDAAVPWADHERADAKARAEEAWKLCQDLAREPDILAKFGEELAAAGLVGETRAAKLLYLVVTSRLLDRIVSAALKGPSSGGKSNLVERVTSFFPGDAFYALSAMGERAIAYSKEPLVHRTLVVYEVAGMSGDFASYLIRSLLSEGRIRYETVMKTARGLQAVLIEREGPTGLLVTTTAVHLHRENETRLLSIPVTDTREQTHRILTALADESQRETVDVEPWHALQTWLANSEERVTIPYAASLADLVPPVAVRLRRDFGALLGLIRAHALLHQATRQRDAEGRIVATLDDYAAVRDLVADIIADGVEASVPDTVRETVTAVVELLKEQGKRLVLGVSVTALAHKLKLDKAAASRRVNVAIEGGYLRNEETRKGRPAIIIEGEPLPDDMEVLPTVERVKERHEGAPEGAGEADPPTHDDSADADRCSVDPLQEGVMQTHTPSSNGATEPAGNEPTCPNCSEPLTLHRLSTSPHRRPGQSL